MKVSSLPLAIDGARLLNWIIQLGTLRIFLKLECWSGQQVPLTSPTHFRHEDPEAIENFAYVWSSDEEAGVDCHANENLEIPSGESCKMQSSEESPTSSSSHLQGNASCPIVEELPEMSRHFPRENVFGKVVNINCDINKETDFDECVKGLSENCKGPSRVGTRINTLFAGTSWVNDPTGLGPGGILVGTNSFTNARASSSLHSALGLEDLVSDSSFRSWPNVIFFSKSIDFVPDSYDNQDSVLGKSRLENEEVNQRPRAVGSKDPLFSSSSPCKDLLNPIHRRLVRKSIREAIDGASPSLPEHSSAPFLEKLDFIDEALAVWEIVTQRFIALVGVIKSVNLRCGLLNVYGPSMEADKEAFFSELLSCMVNLNVPWCIGGDLNVFLHAKEKLGGNVNIASMEILRRFINGANLIDLPLGGGSFTWSNHRDPPTWIRLDRFLVSPQFTSTFPLIEQMLLEKSILDHTAIALVNNVLCIGPRPFKIFNHLLVGDGFEEMVSSKIQSFKSRNRRMGVMKLLKDSKNAIKEWSAKKKIESHGNIHMLELEIHSIENKLQLGLGDLNSISALNLLRDKLWKELRKEELSWLQKSRLRWFSDGDRNTRFFHITASNRRRVNSLNGICHNGVLISNQELLKAYVKDFFSKAYNLKTALEVESYHLLFNCDLVWNVWKGFAAFGGIHTVFPGNPGSFLEAWFEECLIKSLNSTWQFIPFVVLWTIWLYRNDVVFNKNIPDSSQIFSLAKIRLAKWFKAKFPLMAVSVDDLVANPSIVDFLDKNRVTPVVIVAWEAPPLGYLKLNIDGAMLRDGSKGGIGGILRNEEGRCIASFYGSVGQGCPILTELLAVKYGLDNFLGLSVDSNMRLIVECDSKVAVDWILNPERCQSLFLPLVHNIQSLLLCCRAFLKHIPRGANIEADILAKKGIG
ncbi:hypothetical protein V6N11_006883 [Hibiscus sabdariffa]|uniref:RNase H type-1 domain-containing protein n=1 Tax=Hibiscus sabdariffa TaxID=183260 RepID=A0ABR2RSP1_9ROSI